MFYRSHPLLTTLLFFLLTADLHAELLIKGVRIINKDGVISAPSSVYIQDGLISKIDKSIKPRAGDKIIDGSDRFLIPGLIDSHVHLHGVPGESDALPESIRSQAIRQIPRSYLYFGFTTVLDVMGGDAFIAQWNKQETAPKAYHCVGVPIPGGYPMGWIPKNKQLSSPMATFYLFDPRQGALMSSTKGSDNHRVEPLVNRIANTQARCIKTYYEKGFGPFQNLSTPTTAMIKELVQEADKYDLPVFIHGNSMDAHKFAIDVGAAMLTHSIWHGADETRVKALHQLASLFKASNVAVQPTIQVIYGEKEIFNPHFFENPLVRKTIPGALINWYQSDAGQWFAERMAVNYGIKELAKDRRIDAAESKLKGPLETVKIHTGALLSEKVSLQFGSDTPSGPLYTQFPGFNGREEMSRWAELGVPLLTLFRALTYHNAKLLRLERSIGSVEEGKQADLLLLQENPIESVSAYDSIEWVILQGKAIEREQLSTDQHYE